jgi:hypothetical protein
MGVVWRACVVMMYGEREVKLGEARREATTRLGTVARNGVGRGSVALAEAIAGCVMCRSEGEAEVQLCE